MLLTRQKNSINQYFGMMRNKTQFDFINQTLKERYSIMYGGKRSGKTYSRLTWLFLRALLYPDQKIQIIAQSLPIIKTGCLSDFRAVVGGNFKNWNIFLFLILFRIIQYFSNIIIKIISCFIYFFISFFGTFLKIFEKFHSSDTRRRNYFDIIYIVLSVPITTKIYYTI